MNGEHKTESRTLQTVDSAKGQLSRKPCVRSVRHHRYYAVLAMVLSVIACFLVAECSMRVLQFPFSGGWEPSENALAQFDEDLGWSYRPNTTVTQTFGSDPTPIEMHFDESGIRVANRTRRLQRDRASILFVGGSFTMGHGLTFENTFIGQLSAQMETAKLQMVNLGVQGFGTDQALLQLRKHIDRFHTKAVVYTFMADHTRRNANHDRRLIFPAGRFIGTKPKFRLDKERRPVLQKRPQRYEDANFIWLHGVLQGAWLHWGPRPSTRLTASLVVEMQKLTAACGGQFVLVDWNQDESSQSVESIFSDTGIHVVDTRRDAPKAWTSWRIPDDNHPDEVAHMRVASLLSEKLVEVGVALP